MKGIMCKDHFIPKILDGSKSMTRRTGGLKKVNEYPHEWDWFEKDNIISFVNNHTGEIHTVKPRYKKGEVIYLKETWAKGHDMFIYRPPNYVYKVDYESSGLNDRGKKIKWKNKMFMPEWASRCKLEIVDVRVERAQDISLDDCIKEGVIFFGWSKNLRDSKGNEIPECCKPQHYTIAFKKEWDKINPKYKFASNPWVFCYELKRVDK